MPQIEFRNVQPQEAIRFFGDKLPRESNDWREVWQEEHARAFTVARSAGRDILGDIRSAVDDAIGKGQSFDDFKKNLTPVLQAKGWWGKAQERDPQTGEMVTVRLGSTRRLATIYDTNISMAFAAGRWERINRVKDGRPYLMYDHLEGQAHPRLLHASWDGITLPVDDPWWRTHYPPNGWHCHCSVISLSQAQYDRMKISGTIKTQAPAEDLRDWTNKRTGQTIKAPNGVDPGFAYNVGVAHMRESTPPPLDGEPGVAADSPTRKLFPTEGRPDIPPARPAKQSDLVAADQSDAQYVAAFMNELQSLVRAKTGDDQFVLGDGAVVKDPINLPITVSDRFFVEDSGKSKLDSNRAPFVKLLARTLIDPDEIWLSFEPAKAGGYQLRRRYLARWAVAGKTQPATVVIEEWKDGWRGVSAFAPPRGTYLDNQVRLGWLAYRRGR
jgi:hypothetical protein